MKSDVKPMPDSFTSKKKSIKQIMVVREMRFSCMENAREVSFFLFLSLHDEISEFLDGGSCVLFVYHVVCGDEVLVIFESLGFHHVVDLSLNMIFAKNLESTDDDFALEQGMLNLHFFDTSVVDLKFSSDFD